MDPALAATIIAIFNQGIQLLMQSGVTPAQLKAAQDETARLEIEALKRLAEIEAKQPPQT